MILARLNSTSVREGFRIIKSVWAKNITETSNLSSPFGFDCNPLQNEICVVAETGNNSDSVVVGFVTKQVLEDLSKGEIGLYAKNADGETISTIKHRNDGSIEINGNDDFMVRFSKLEEAYNELQEKYNDLANEWTIFTQAYVPGGTSTQGLPVSLTAGDLLSRGDISSAKIGNVKTNSDG